VDKAGRCVMLTTLSSSCVVIKSGKRNFPKPSGPLQACFTFYWGVTPDRVSVPITLFDPSWVNMKAYQLQPVSFQNTILHV